MAIVCNKNIFCEPRLGTMKLSGKRSQNLNQRTRKSSTIRTSSIISKVPYVLSIIAVFPCVSLIWNSLQVTNSIPKHSHFEVFGTDPLLPLTASDKNTGPSFTDGTLLIDSEKTAKEVLTLFLQEKLPTDATPKLTELRYPHLGISSCSGNRNSIVVPKLPIDEYPSTDPYIPWIHDYHINYPVASEVRFVAQNRRRCYTGIHMESQAMFWEPQVALFQHVSVVEEASIDDTKAMQYRLTSMENATYNETRFLCHFHAHAASYDARTGSVFRQQLINETTLSTYFFNYEYVLWRKSSNYLPMYERSGSKVSNFVLSQLLFKCPIPSKVRDTLLSLKARSSFDVSPVLYLDVIPIRAPPRFTKLPMVTMDLVGPVLFGSMSQDKEWLNTVTTYAVNNNKIIPEIESSGRYANLPLCGHESALDKGSSQSHPSDALLLGKKYYLVACTWTSASYYRRGDNTVVDDAPSRLLEWILFQRLVGIDHVFLYDNTQMVPGGNETSPLWKICKQFPDYVTYIAWPASVCNNNRPNHKNPGERSSQYAAEASCRSRFGDSTEWMTFIDTDEYIVPLMQQQHHLHESTPAAEDVDKDQRNLTTWYEVLQVMKNKGYYILKMPSSRGRPRVNLMEESSNVANSACGLVIQSVQLNNNDSSCLVPRRNETYLRVYNCDYIRHPRPDRFLRAMKQIYRPSYVLSHFVHYAAVTLDMARYYKDYPNDTDIPYSENIKQDSIHEYVLDELTEGVLIHAKSVLPHETSKRAKSCYTNSKKVCSMGYACHSTTPFDDLTHTKNIFRDNDGNFCNCWIDEQIENYWIPLLQRSLEEHQ